MKTRSIAAAVLALAMLAPACALTSKSEVLEVRWFTPERVKPTLTSAGATAQTGEPMSLVLGRITAGSHLREKMAYRDSNWEVGYYEDRRWTERPEAFVRREVERTLFEERGFRRALGGTGTPTLEIELLAFEEIRSKPVHAARVQLRMILHDGRDVLHEETITVDRPLGAGDAKVEDVVGAISDALDGASAAIADRASRVLRARAEGTGP